MHLQLLLCHITSLDLYEDVLSHCFVHWAYTGIHWLSQVSISICVWQMWFILKSTEHIKNFKDIKSFWCTTASQPSFQQDHLYPVYTKSQTKSYRRNMISCCPRQNAVCNDHYFFSSNSTAIYVWLVLFNDVCQLSDSSYLWLGKHAYCTLKLNRIIEHKAFCLDV